MPKSTAIRLLLFGACVFFGMTASANQQKADTLYGQSNFAEAYLLYQALASDANASPKTAGANLEQAVTCLRRLNRVAEWDALREQVAAAHPGSWEVAEKIVKISQRMPTYGYLVAGKFERGSQRGGHWQNHRSCRQRDRVRNLQLMTEALPGFLAARSQLSADDEGLYLRNFHRLLLESQESWRGQLLTDLSVLPDYDAQEEAFAGRGAPVNPDGTPVFYSLPPSFADAQNDGQRWRWILHLEDQSRFANIRYQAKLAFADFLNDQFGVKTLSSRFHRYGDPSPAKDSLNLPLAVSNLTEDETLARLADGIRRFKLPDEFNHIKIYQQLYADYPDLSSAAVSALASLFANRRQYVKSVSWWEKFAPFNAKTSQQKIFNIIGNWCELQPESPRAAGQDLTVALRFRNASKVKLTAQRLNLPAMVEASKKHILKGGDNNHLSWEMVQLNQLFRTMIESEKSPYIQEQMASWEASLEPLPEHQERLVTLNTPLRAPGAYLLTATTPEGNTSRVPILIEEAKIISKPLAKEHLWQVVAADSGAPLPGLQIRLFGWESVWNQKTKRNQIITRETVLRTDANGMAILPKPKKDSKDMEQMQGMRWLAETETASGTYACHGFDWINFNVATARGAMQRNKTFAITDRPVYRPGQTVEYKFWLAEVAYDLEVPNPLAGTKVTARIFDPQGKKAQEVTFTADAVGGLSGNWDIPRQAALGAYSLQFFSPEVSGLYHQLSFRVEEYKKPEFEVTVDLPAEAPLLGDSIPVTVRAGYYFGAPVSSAQVSIRVLRYDHHDYWWPTCIWDWFYGNGYGWLSEDAYWHPGWRRWGRPRPYFTWWRPRPQGAPEVVAQIDRQLGEDGTVTFTLDTAMTKELFADRDHRYEITAEVTDQSRRAIVGNGTVTVAREPFTVFVWPDRGYYHVGDQINVRLQASTLSRQPVVGDGMLRLYRIFSDPQGNVQEKLEQEWQVSANEDGRAKHRLQADAAGQYRLAWTVTDSKKRNVEGAIIITVRGEKNLDADFHYNALEIVPEMSEYAPGDKVRLAINTARPNSTVMVCLRPEGDNIERPMVLRIQGKSQLLELSVTKADMPNFFVEAYTVSDGKFHQVSREIMVPPEKKILEVEVLPEKVEHLPGDEAQLAVRITDSDGRPHAGNLAVAVYDASLDYIAGDILESDIRAAFWKWRRQHNPTGSVMSWYLPKILWEKEDPMPHVGIFGDLDLPDTDSPLAGGAAFRGFSANAFGAVGDMGIGRNVAMAAAAPKARLRSEVARLDENQSTSAEPPSVRSQFADTALWLASLNTDAQGMTTIKVPMPENLTRWKVRVWAIDDHTRVGMGTTELITSKNLILRLQAPRFLVEKDEVVLSANVHNYLPESQEVKVKLELGGPCLQMLATAEQQVTLAAGGEARVDWRVRAVQEGEATVRMFAVAPLESDAMEQRFPVKVHGIDKTVAATGILRPEQSKAEVALRIPAERRPETTELVVRWSPSLALAMLDAIPYLLTSPYGSTDSSLNKFLPAVLTRKTMLELGLDLEQLEKHRAQLNAGELGDPQQRRQQWQRDKQEAVFSTETMDTVTNQGVKDLCAMQCADGGWGWFSGWGERSWTHTTAQVVQGFLLAQQAGVEIPPEALQRGTNWLQEYQSEQLWRLKLPATDGDHKLHADNLDAMVYRVLTLAPEQTDNQTAMARRLFQDKQHLSPYGLALLGLGLSNKPDTPHCAEVLRNLKQFLVEDGENQTAWLRLDNNYYWWLWHGDEIETHAAFLRLLVILEPKGELAPKLVKYLLANRKHATYWRSTRDTAACLEAFAAYIEAAGEMNPDLTIEISLDGQPLASSRITRENLFTGDFSLQLSGNQLSTGEHILTLRKSGTGPLYFNTFLSYFTTEDMITKTGLEVKVERQVFKLERDDQVVATPMQQGRPTDKRVEKHKRLPVTSETVLQSGDLLEIELTVDSKNDYEYILLEDYKAAGCEPVDLRSGYTGNAFGAYVEFREDKTAFLLRRLPRGQRSASYRVKAEIPGRFSALPSIITGVYAPELKGNADELKITIE